MFMVKPALRLWCYPILTTWHHNASFPLQLIKHGDMISNTVSLPGRRTVQGVRSTAGLHCLITGHKNWYPVVFSAS